MKIEYIAILLVGIGGFAGAISRYGISEMLASDRFPYAILLVNVAGSFILGFLIFSQVLAGDYSDEWRLFLGVGFLGAFTTMSAFSADTIALMENNEVLMAGINVLLNVGGSIGAAFLGWAVAT